MFHFSARIVCKVCVVVTGFHNGPSRHMCWKVVNLGAQSELLLCGGGNASRPQDSMGQRVELSVFASASYFTWHRDEVTWHAGGLYSARSTACSEGDLCLYITGISRGGLYI